MEDFYSLVSLTLPKALNASERIFHKNIGSMKGKRPLEKLKEARAQR